MQKNSENRNQMKAAEKAFAWMRCSKPSVAAREPENQPEGIALPPNSRGCGTAYPMRGTDRETLNAWCREHET